MLEEGVSPSSNRLSIRSPFVTLARGRRETPFNTEIMA